MTTKLAGGSELDFSKKYFNDSISNFPQYVCRMYCIIIKYRNISLTFGSRVRYGQQFYVVTQSRKILFD